MSSGIKKSLIAFSISSALFAPSAFATNGYFSHGYSTAEKGLAGAGAAYSHDALASATNPAGLVKVGERLDVGAALFSPDRKYTASSAAGGGIAVAPGTYESDHTFFMIPHFGYSMKIDDVSSFVVAAFGSVGILSVYRDVPGSGTFRWLFSRCKLGAVIH